MVIGSDSSIAVVEEVLARGGQTGIIDQHGSLPAACAERTATSPPWSCSSECRVRTVLTLKPPLES